MKNIRRQGDVYIFEIDKLPKGIEKKSVKQVVLAEGEVTGHKHLLLANSVDTVMAIGYDSNGDGYLKISDGSATLKHEEHHAIKLPAGDYRVTIQREYDPREYQRKVMD